MGICNSPLLPDPEGLRLEYSSQNDRDHAHAVIIWHRGCWIPSSAPAPASHFSKSVLWREGRAPILQSFNWSSPPCPFLTLSADFLVGCTIQLVILLLFRDCLLVAVKSASAGRYASNRQLLDLYYLCPELLDSEGLAASGNLHCWALLIYLIMAVLEDLSSSFPVVG